jgi:hypothetical protein
LSQLKLAKLVLIHVATAAAAVIIPAVYACFVPCQMLSPAPAPAWLLAGLHGTQQHTHTLATLLDGQLLASQSELCSLRCVPTAQDKLIKVQDACVTGRTLTFP